MGIHEKLLPAFHLAPDGAPSGSTKELVEKNESPNPDGFPGNEGEFSYSSPSIEHTFGSFEKRIQMGQSMADQATLRSGSDGEGTPTAQVGLKVRWEDRHSYILAPGQKWTKRGIFAVVKRA